MLYSAVLAGLTYFISLSLSDPSFVGGLLPGLDILGGIILSFVGGILGLICGIIVVAFAIQPKHAAIFGAGYSFVLVIFLLIFDEPAPGGFEILPVFVFFLISAAIFIGCSYLAARIARKGENPDAQ